jgi:hypothetical protein
MYFDMKNYLKSNPYHTAKHPLSGFAGIESSLLPELLAIRQGLLVGMG